MKQKTEAQKTEAQKYTEMCISLESSEMLRDYLTISFEWASSEKGAKYWIEVRDNIDKEIKRLKDDILSSSNHCKAIQEDKEDN